MAQQAEPRPRLMIRQMVLENFKSYAGTQYVGPFHKVRRWGAAVGPRERGRGRASEGGEGAAAAAPAQPSREPRARRESPA